MNVFILGGTGFLGYHATLEFLRRGHHVTSLARQRLLTEMLPAEVEVHLGDFDLISDGEVRELMAGHDAAVFAAGADDRALHKPPAYRYFYHANVEACSRFLRLAGKAGIRRASVCGSYFCHFDRLWPEQRLAERHPYIRSRVEQEQEAITAGGKELDVMILELPYIFGAMPGRMPIWQPVVRYAASPWPLFFPKGGTNMIAVEHVAEAIAGAVERGRGGERYLVGDENLTWKEWLERLSRLAGRSKRVITVPTPLVRLGLYGVLLSRRLKGVEGGLNPAALAGVQTAETFFDPTPSREALGYGKGGLEESFKKTVEACLNRSPVSSQVIGN